MTTEAGNYYVPCDCTECDCPSGVGFDEAMDGDRLCRDCSAGFHFEGFHEGEF